jgi:hypothetical protein
MKNEYGIDFDTIRKKLYEGSTMSMSADRYAPSNSQDFSYIYE